MGNKLSYRLRKDEVLDESPSVRDLKDSLKRQVLHLWCKNLLEEEEYDRIKEMIESPDRENRIIARSIIQTIGERHNINMSEDG